MSPARLVCVSFQSRFGLAQTVGFLQPLDAPLDIEVPRRQCLPERQRLRRNPELGRPSFLVAVRRGHPDAIPVAVLAVASGLISASYRRAGWVYLEDVSRASVENVSSTILMLSSLRSEPSRCFVKLTI